MVNVSELNDASFLVVHDCLYSDGHNDNGLVV